MSGYDWQQAGAQRGEERDRSAVLRSETVAAAPARLNAALDRIADMLVSLNQAPSGDTQPAPSGDTQPAPSGDTQPAPSGDTQPAPSGDTQPAHDVSRQALLEIEQRLDGAIALLREVLQPEPGHGVDPDMVEDEGA